MGIVQAEITLKNAFDVGNSQRGLIKAQDIRLKTIQAVVDTGAMTLVIDEELCLELGLGIMGKRQVTLANDVKETVKIAEPVEVHWKDRDMVCRPWVVQNTPKTLLGAIPLEEMDLMVDPKHQELVGAHGDEIESLLL